MIGAPKIKREKSVQEFKELIEYDQRNINNKWKELNPDYVNGEFNRLVREEGISCIVEIRDGYAKSAEENMKLGKQINLFTAASEFLLASRLSNWLGDSELARKYLQKYNEADISSKKQVVRS